MAETLERVDSAVDGLSTSPPKEKTAAARRKSSMAPGVNSIKDLGKFIRRLQANDGDPGSIMVLTTTLTAENKTSIEVTKETQGTGWYVTCREAPRIFYILTLGCYVKRKVNTSPMTVEEKEILGKQLVEPPVKAIDLYLNEPMPGDQEAPMFVTARSRTGVTIKDALTAIHKHYRKKASQYVSTLLPTQLAFCPNSHAVIRKMMKLGQNRTSQASSGRRTDLISRPKRARRRERRSGIGYTCTSLLTALPSSPPAERRRTRRVVTNCDKLPGYLDV